MDVNVLLLFGVVSLAAHVETVLGFIEGQSPVFVVLTDSFDFKHFY